MQNRPERRRHLRKPQLVMTRSVRGNIGHDRDQTVLLQLVCYSRP